MNNPNQIIKTGQTFGQALEALQEGKRVARSGWNGKDMWLSLSGGPSRIPAEKFWSPNNAAYAASQPDGCATVLPAVTMKTATGEIVMGWLANQTDMLASDWVVLEPLVWTTTVSVREPGPAMAAEMPPPPPVPPLKDRFIVGIKQQRKDLDDLVQQAKHLSVVAGLKELEGELQDKPELMANLTLSRRHIEDAVMRLGMALKAIGTPNPYPDSKNPGNTTINPTADGLKL